MIIGKSNTKFDKISDKHLVVHSSYILWTMDNLALVLPDKWKGIHGNTQFSYFKSIEIIDIYDKNKRVHVSGVKCSGESFINYFKHTGKTYRYYNYPVVKKEKITDSKIENIPYDKEDMINQILTSQPTIKVFHYPEIQELGHYEAVYNKWIWDKKALKSKSLEHLLKVYKTVLKSQN